MVFVVDKILMNTMNPFIMLPHFFFGGGVKFFFFLLNWSIQGIVGVTKS